jgi:hypothetical protein
MASDRGGPGRHRVRAVPSAQSDRRHGLSHLVPRGPTEPLEAWQARWVRTPDVAALQLLLNELGASLVVDGVFGPATDAAVRTCERLRRRDRIGQSNCVSAHAPEPGLVGDDRPPELARRAAPRPHRWGES